LATYYMPSFLSFILHLLEHHWDTEIRQKAVHDTTTGSHLGVA